MDRVRKLWRSQITTEYTSSAQTAELLHWLIVVGASPDVIERGRAIVGDEQRHAEFARDVYIAAGGDDGQVDLDPAQLVSKIDLGAPLLARALSMTAKVFCCGESVAVPLFLELHEHAREPVVVTALARICQDEARHRAFGWDTLDELLELSGEQGRSWLKARVPAFIEGVVGFYSGGREGPFPEHRRHWGMLPPHRYGEIATRCAEEVLRPRFRARGLLDEPTQEA